MNMVVWGQVKSENSSLPVTVLNFPNQISLTTAYRVSFKIQI